MEETFANTTSFSESLTSRKIFNCLFTKYVSQIVQNYTLQWCRVSLKTFDLFTIFSHDFVALKKSLSIIQLGNIHDLSVTH